MLFSKINYSSTPLKEFKVYGSKIPTAQEPQPQIFVSTIFAKNSVLARSRFFKILNAQHKIKATNGLVLKIEVVAQDNDFVLKNYGINFVYRTRTGLQNGYREVRHINRALAVADMNQDFCGTHKIKASDIFIFKIDIVKDEDLRRARVLAYSGNNVKFPVFNKVPNTTEEFVPTSVEIFN